MRPGEVWEHEWEGRRLTVLILAIRSDLSSRCLILSDTRSRRASGLVHDYYVQPGSWNKLV